MRYGLRRVPVIVVVVFVDNRGVLVGLVVVVVAVVVFLNVVLCIVWV